MPIYGTFKRNSASLYLNSALPSDNLLCDQGCDSVQKPLEMSVHQWNRLLQAFRHNIFHS